MTTYREHATLLSPPWLRTPRAEGFILGQADERDALVGRAVEAVSARAIQLASEDALGLLAEERGLERFPGEALEVYRSRLLDAFDILQWAGTPASLVAAMAGLGFAAAVLERDRIPSLYSVAPVADGSVLADGQYVAGGGPAWSWFVLELAVPDGAVFDATTLARVQRMVERTKAAHTRLMAVLLAIAPGNERIGLDDQGTASEICALPHADGSYPADGRAYAGITCPVPEAWEPPPLMDPGLLTIAPGQTLTGELTTASDVNPTRTATYKQDYRLIGVNAGDQVVIREDSAAFDGYLQIVDEQTGQVLAQNDDFNGLNPQITLTVQAGVSYLVRCTTYAGWATGVFTVSATRVASSAQPGVPTPSNLYTQYGGWLATVAPAPGYTLPAGSYVLMASSWFGNPDGYTVEWTLVRDGAQVASVQRHTYQNGSTWVLPWADGSGNGIQITDRSSDFGSAGFTVG